jgi:hypothetical protein
MPQTLEALDHAKAAGVPIVVAVNKVDLEDADPQRVRTQLVEHGVVPSEWGGDYEFVDVSAKQGTNLDRLLETILLVAELAELKGDPTGRARGTVIEAHLDRGRGPVATVLVQKGVLQAGDALVSGTAYCRVRAMLDENGRPTRIPPVLPETEEEPDASLVARTALEFDTGTFVRNRSPLQMLHALREAAEGEAQTKVLEALLSEEGQELCIAHARGVRHRSVSVPKLLNEALQALKPGRPRVAVKEEVVAPTRISGRALGSGQRRQEAAREDVEATLRAAKSEAFDKRRQALRAGRSPKGLRFEGADGAHERPVQNGHDGRADAADDAGKQRSEEALGEAPHAAPEARAPESVTRPETPPDDLDIASEAPDVEPAAAEARDEEPVAEEAPAAETKQDHNGQGGGLWLPPTYHDAAPREEAPTMQTSAPDTQLAERVEALRARLEQIERSVAEAQQILSGLAPELEGLATWMEELESVVTRWKHGRVA